MGFSVSNFKSNVASEGFHRPAHYDVMLIAPGIDQNMIRLRTESVSAPGISFLSVDGYRPYSSGIIYNIPYSYNPQSISCVHLVDDKAKMMQMFWDWGNKIADLEGEQEHTADYFDNYKGSLLVRMHDNAGGVTKMLSMRDVYPESVDQLQLSWGTSDDISRLNVTYRFSNYRVL